MLYNELGDPLYSLEDQKEFNEYYIKSHSYISGTTLINSHIGPIKFISVKEEFNDEWFREIHKYFIRKERIQKINKLNGIS